MFQGIKKAFREVFSDGADRLSAMRVITVPGAFIGMIGFGSGVVAMFMNLPQAAGIAGIGAGLVTTAMGLKWAQKKVEG